MRRQLLGYLGIFGAFFLWLGFFALDQGWHPGWYLFFQGCNALLSGPMFALITKIKLVNLPNAAKSFPLYAMGGTIGWMSGGCLSVGLGWISRRKRGNWLLIFDSSWASSAFLLPATPPTDHVSQGWKAALGLTAFKLLKVRELRVFYFASALFAIPCVSFYMLVPTMLKEFGSVHPAAQMTLGQAVEIGSMLFLSLVAGRFRIRWFLIAGMVLGVTRFALFALAGELGVLAVIWLGIALHGPIYTLSTVTGRIFLDKRVPDTMRGQAQALYQLLVGSVAGIVGSFFCETVYQHQVTDELSSWTGFWWTSGCFRDAPISLLLCRRDCQVERCRSELDCPASCGALLGGRYELRGGSFPLGRAWASRPTHEGARV